MSVKRCWLVVLVLVIVSVAISAPNAAASSITVASFSWDVLDDPGVQCDPADSECVPIAPSTLSLFGLTDIWDGPVPAPILTGNELALPDQSLQFLDLTAGFPCAIDPTAPLCSFDQILIDGVPGFATVSVSFLFGDQPITLSTTLTQPNSVAALEFTPVPEPGTLALTLIGVAALVRRRPFLQR